MKRIEVEIEGVTPLLMNSPKAMIEQMTNKNAIKSKQKQYDMAVEAEKVCYRMKNGNLYIPSTAIMGAILNASSRKTSGKYALKPLIAASLKIDPLEIDLGTKKYEIDLRTVVIQRARVVKARPVLNKWKAKFGIIYDDEIFQNKDDIRAVLEEAGQRIGILDFRPQKNGPFGTFKVTKFK